MSTAMRFTDRHSPGLEPGNYTITVTQSIEGISQAFKATRNFSVLGPRFTLDPREILELFPAPGSLGDHSNVLPHVILKRSTLPWERRGDPNDPAVPWLALLVFDEQEHIQETPYKLSSLNTRALKFLPAEKGDHGDDQVVVIDVPRTLLAQIIPNAEEVKYLAHVRESQYHEDGAVLLGNRLPKPGGASVVHLVSLEHRYTRGEFDYQGKPDSISLVSLRSWRFACVSAKLDFKGALTHLNHQLLFHFPPQVANSLARTLNTQEIPNEIRSAFAASGSPLVAQAKVSEYSQWRITDQGNRFYFVSNLFNVFNQAGKWLLQLTTAPGPQKLSEQPDILKHFEQARHQLDPKTAIIAKQAETDHWWIRDERNLYFISQESIDRDKKVLYVYRLDPDASNTLRLPPLQAADSAANTVAETYLRRGCVPLPHATRQGRQAISWYHGPLTPGTNTSASDILVRDDNDERIRSADALVRYSKEHGMLEVSYAAAWELGRLLTLQNTKVAVALFNWKRAHAQDEQLKMAEGVLAHLPYEPAKSDLEIPATVTAWFADLAKLQGVPFAYLVPDERLLPLESIRFFCVDWQWMECLLDGAFSVGRVMPIDHQRDRTHAKGAAMALLKRPHDIMTGVLIRSDVVAGWPGLLVDGHDTGGQALLRLRMERLSKNVLLCLFAGKVTTVDVHQKPESLHCGFTRSDSPANGADYYKDKTKPLPLPWRPGGKRVVDIPTLADKLREAAGAPKGSYHSAKFAVDMIEGVEKVRFQVG